MTKTQEEQWVIIAYQGMEDPCVFGTFRSSEEAYAYAEKQTYAYAVYMIQEVK